MTDQLLVQWTGLVKNGERPQTSMHTIVLQNAFVRDCDGNVRGLGSDSTHCFM